MSAPADLARACSERLAHRSRISVAMSGRGHRGKRPRGDGSRGPRSSSSSALPHHSQVSLIQTPMPCTPASGRLVFSMLWLWSRGLDVHILLSLLQQLISKASCGTGTTFVTLLVMALPFVSSIIDRIHRSLHHMVAVLFMAIDLLVPRCMAAQMRGGAVSCEATLAAAGRGRSCSCVVRSGIWLGFLGTCTCGFGLAGKTPSENDVKSPKKFRLRRGASGGACGGQE